MNTPSPGSRGVTKQERDQPEAGRSALLKKQKGRRSFDRRPHEFRILNSEFLIPNS
jgi:hypothetical protein